jgi:hypothetical protein
MPKAVLLSFTGVSDPAREAEFDQWYDNVHLTEVCETPGIVSARRFRASSVQRPGLVGDLPRYLAMYELDTDDVHATMDALQERVRAGEVTAPPEGLLQPNMDYEAGIFEVEFDLAAEMPITTDET